MREYKVLTEKDGAFSGKFEPSDIEKTLNEFAADGWRLISGVPATNVWKSFSAAMILILEREV